MSFFLSDSGIFRIILANDLPRSTLNSVDANGDQPSRKRYGMARANG